MLEKDKTKPSPVLAELLSLWPIFLIVIAGVAVLVWMVKRPALKKKQA
jgi:protein SCO1/2